MKYLVLIGDIVASRSSVDRKKLQKSFNQVLKELNKNNKGLISPYTITLGDEFQVVYDSGDRALKDTATIQAALYPAMVRFSFAIDTITTAINKKQSIGMDGPAFYHARDGINSLKDENCLYRLYGLNPDTVDLANASLTLISNTVRKWKGSRFEILKALIQEKSIKEIASALDISDKGVYKNISDGHIKDVLNTFEILATQINKSGINT